MTANGTAAKASGAAQGDVTNLLKVSRGSFLIPMLLLLASAVAFLAYWLPDGRKLIADEFVAQCQGVKATGSRPGLPGLSLDPAKADVAEGAAKGVAVLAPKHESTPDGAQLTEANGYWLNKGLKEGVRITAVGGMEVRESKALIEAVTTQLAQDALKKFETGQATTPEVELTVEGKTAPIRVALPASVPFYAPASQRQNDPKHYRDWCAAPAGGPSVTELRDDFERQALRSRDGYWDATLFRSFASEKAEPAEVGRTLFVRLKLFADDVLASLRENWDSAAATLGMAFLFALIPGFAGLIYRRAFWPWFGIAFVGILAIRAFFASVWSSVAAGEQTTTSWFASSVLVFVLAQLTVLLLSHRLRRHSVEPVLLARIVQPVTYNRVLYYALAAFGVGMAIPASWGGIGWFDPVFALFEGTLGSTFVKWNAILLGLPFLYFMLKVTPSLPNKGPKNILICLDGTSNTPDQLDRGTSSQTNVFKLFSMLKSDPRGSFAPSGWLDATLAKLYDDRQVGLYYTGIGNKYDSDPVIGTLSQATGMGASGIIERAYLDLVRIWRPGDRVFIVGFSRGAASARILSRVIDQRGAPRSIWALRLFGRHWTLWPSAQTEKVPIDMLGCWDTVGSFGIGKTIGGINFQQLNLLHDLTVPDNVVKAYHMVALDEERQEFEPTLMDPDPLNPDRIVEVWFAGSHAGVGGGWGTHLLSDVPLDFLVRRISSGYCFDGTTEPGDESWGLFLTAANGVNTAALQKVEKALQDSKRVEMINPDPLGLLLTYFSSVFNYRPRQLPLHAVVSEMVFDRMTQSQPIYAPQALFNLSEALDKKRDLVMKTAEKLKAMETMNLDEQTKVEDFAKKLTITRASQVWGGKPPASWQHSDSTAVAASGPPNQ